MPTLDRRMTGAGARLLHRTESVPPWIWQGAVMLFGVALTIYYTTRTGRDFWYDEAMLVQAIRLDGWLPPWRPLSHFEQASPWGVYLVQKAMLEGAGFRPELLRIPGFIAYAVGGLAVWRAASLWFGGGAALLAGVAALVSVDVVQTAGDFKHYIFEFAVSGVALWLTARVLRVPTLRRVAVLVGVLVLSIPFSNTVVFVVPGIALALFLAIPRLRRATIIGGVVFAGAYGLWFLFCLRPSTVYQLAYPSYRESSSVDGYTQLVQAVVQPGGGYFVSLAAVATTGLAVAAVWQQHRLGAFLPALVAVVLGWVAVRLGVVPFSADRHLLFLVPLVALAVGASVRAVIESVSVNNSRLQRPQPIVSALIAVVLAFGATATIAPSAALVRQQTGQALAASSTTCSSYFVDWWSQPMVTLYAEKLGISDKVHGGVSTRSGLGQESWLYRVTSSPASYQRRLVDWMSAHPTSCLVTVGGASEPEIVFQPLVAAGLVCSALPSPTGIFLNRCARPKA